MYHQRQITIFITITSLLVCGGCAAVPRQGEDDRARILARHEHVIDAHITRDVEGMLEGASEDYILVNRGEVSYPTIDERRNRFSGYFKITSFSTYRDLIPPIVHISDDGTAAWLIAQVEVSGSQEVAGEDQPFDFVSAWIELYEKRNGEWVQVGNVSNFRP